jgi:hypothetical protein
MIVLPQGAFTHDPAGAVRFRSGLLGKALVPSITEGGLTHNLHHRKAVLPNNGDASDGLKERADKGLNPGLVH